MQPSTQQGAGDDRPEDPGGSGGSSPPGGTGPTGKVISPGLVVVFGLITLGIYFVFWGWLRTQEADAYSSGRAEAHGPFRTGVFIGLGGLILAIIGWITGFGSLLSGDPEAGLAGFGVGMALILLAGLVGLVAAVFTYIGYWRLWRFVEAQERALGSMNPLSPGLMLALLLIPIVNYVGMFYVPYRTQKGLNGIWRGRRPGQRGREQPTVG